MQQNRGHFYTKVRWIHTINWELIWNRLFEMKIRLQSKMPLKSLKSLICVWTQVECRRLNYWHYTWLSKVSFGIEANAMAHYQWVSKSKGQVAYNLFIEKSAIFSSAELAIWINSNWQFVIRQKLIRYKLYRNIFHPKQPTH